NFNSGKRSMCLAIMAWAVCRKKVLMRNPLNVLVGIGGFGGILQRSQVGVQTVFLLKTYLKFETHCKKHRCISVQTALF
ncbi:TPA: hypothetical protein ACLA99_001818, partial [Neisseria meningitidis]